ncbi:uncharacterized protein SCHCODRAFT_02507671 [Schizophyllum commune H4-8]|uniref:Expressed protein n=1 Tax=Schizophyllum commune (strain H4-8 / FGSC 9210) TaxID=578458 RepID=D8QAM9_SCHCM|nr:uncharacterized protein SCHCODRAFT_02507671 [Schizophyllum commune H4-8]KAI5889914.1 hypothetical protein SCHCODRAFT_02507671 [Schizophyllum commune H4-8]
MSEDNYYLALPCPMWTRTRPSFMEDTFCGLSVELTNRLGAWRFRRWWAQSLNVFSLLTLPPRIVAHCIDEDFDILVRVSTFSPRSPCTSCGAPPTALALPRVGGGRSRPLCEPTSRQTTVLDLGNNVNDAPIFRKRLPRTPTRHSPPSAYFSMHRGYTNLFIYSRAGDAPPQATIISQPGARS